MNEIWQGLRPVLLPVRTVGVDGGCPDLMISSAACRAVPPPNGITADSYHLRALLHLGRGPRIINEVGAIKPVVYDVTSKPPGTIEWE